MVMGWLSIPRVQISELFIILGLYFKPIFFQYPFFPFFFFRDSVMHASIHLYPTANWIFFLFYIIFYLCFLNHNVNWHFKCAIVQISIENFCHFFQICNHTFKLLKFISCFSNLSLYQYSLWS